MGNCCATPQTDDYETKNRGKKKQNPFSLAYVNSNSNGGFKLVVLKEPTGLEIEKRYELGRELGRGEFGITYLCTDKETGEKFGCKSISKDELRTAVDIEDVRRSRSRDVQHNNC